MASYLIQGEYALRDALMYQANGWVCPIECPDDSHDDTCLLLLAEVLLAVLPKELLDTKIQELWEKRNG